ncbi:hypothetical protein ORJ04_08910 [Rheinheimera baltica]|uniref:Uncharacterized protein n=1 Tax=Rheinheimera baltica TaxID=67576 RepID=A0ABT9HZ17_9GAMM|nr:hypothetical protein [Rheinheimera baltica]MDP5136065.1 hypothetical protein [Rheinheimera baltica]
MDWRKLEIFKGIDLNDSFILDWSHESGRLSFELEASIWPESAYYVAPKPDEYTCYRKATLLFKNIKAVTGLKAKNAVITSTDAGGSVDYGNIDSFIVLNDGFELEGDIGCIKVFGGELRFEIQT